MTDKAVGLIMIAVGLILLIGAFIYGSGVRDDCHDKGGVMLQGQCVKADIIKL
jgi:hypothetical protein